MADWLSSHANILNNIAHSIEPLQKLITATGYIIGSVFLFKALYSLKIYGESRTMQSSSTSIKEPLVYLFVGTLLIYSPTAFQIVMQSTFGYENILQYAPVGHDANGIFGQNSLIGRPIALIIQVVGYVAFIRGWVLIARAASQGQPPGGTGKGLMHVLGGILAINIIGTLQLINNTLYGG